ncbi:hypothetical protein [Brevundimonas sp.]|uniref:hypothetical protein n=1 Tax=Brevundimonas sp. TaxID=1871086 RepID=UPI002D42C09D|nr:hypothetical protein [Brevundimonas sp.]HYC66691.1 hypothetical protein [Brevundimonas sp.]
MSYLRKLIGAAFVMAAVQVAIPGPGLREWFVGLFAYTAVLILVPTPPAKEPRQ